MKKKTKQELVPIFGFGFENVNSSFIPMFNYGLRYGSVYNYETEDHNLWYLTLDNYYNYSGTGTSQQKREVYRFLTFKYMSIEAESIKSKGFQTNVSFSLGYLVSKSGDMFQANSFKLTVPSLKYGWLSIGPELFFNDFFNVAREL